MIPPALKNGLGFSHDDFSHRQFNKSMSCPSFDNNQTSPEKIKKIIVKIIFSSIDIALIYLAALLSRET